MIQDIYGHIANIYKIISDIGTNSDVAKEAIEKIVIPVGTMGEQLKVLSTTLNNIELELVKEVVYDLLKKRAVRLALISIPIVSAVVGFLAAFLAIKVF
jgi:mannose/fructose/N-acetylgalactosamine-specific phosphotransferase system component IIC